MITKNEEKNLPVCLESVKKLVDEIIIVDTGSTDNTKHIALHYGAKVYDFEWNNDFSAARNYALSKSTSDWNLVLDADEKIINWDSDRLEKFKSNPFAIGRIKIISSFVQNNEKRLSQDFISRLLPKGVFFTGKIHEQIDSNFPRMDLPIEVFHTGYLSTDKSERNLQLLLLEVEKSPQNPYILYQLGRQFRTDKQIDTANIYFAKAYNHINRDEKYAVDLIVNYLYTLIYIKQYHEALEIIVNERDWLTKSPDFHFVCGIFYMNYVLVDPRHNLSYLKNIEKSYLNCLAIQQNGWEEIVIGTSSFLAAYNLGVFYETTGNLIKAKEFYQLAANDSYKPAFNRLDLLNKY
ncbi:glycosyltransferase family 2 protein [Bacillus sp. C11]|nr:glycosyltransferase family 2 protein [Neobacillus terrae]